MNTPIACFLREFSTRGALRMHMPGHKGTLSEHDITEIAGADVLYSPAGIIKESEENAASLFGTARTVYSAEGSSLSVKAMLALAVMYARQRGEKPLILAGRNAHKTFISAAALLDFDFEWIWGESLIECKITENMLRNAIKSAPSKPTALYITSPDYLGNVADISALSAVCREAGILLLVDNAHGAYLKFLPEDIHPITLGADMSCDSAHKTLPCLTGGAYLQISKNAPSLFCERADEAMSLFASTSPSYLILESLDLLNKYIEDGYREKLADFIKIRNKACCELRALGFGIADSEPLKITLKAKDYGYTGWDIDRFLAENGIICEFADEDFTVLMLSPEFSEEDMKRLVLAMAKLSRKSPLEAIKMTPPRLVKKMPPKEAVLCASEEVGADESVGRVLSSASVSCPPAVPIAMSGELITKEAAECFKHYGTQRLRVVKE